MLKNELRKTTIILLILLPKFVITESSVLRDKSARAVNVTEYVGQRVHDYYFNDADDDFLVEACLLGTAKDYLSWLDTDCHITPPMGVSKQSVLDLSHLNMTEDDVDQILVGKQPTEKHKILIISLAYNSFTKIPYDVLSIFKEDAQRLSLTGNPIGAIFKKTTFHGVAIKQRAIGPKQNGFPVMKELEELDMRDCDLKTIEANSFADLKNLKKLFLANNKIVNIISKAFNGLRQLRHLDLSKNNDSEERSIIRFGKFDAYWNMLNGLALHKDIFDDLDELTFLDLSQTKLQAYSGVALAYLGKKLEQLSLCHTQIPVIADGMFQYTMLKVLDISGNPTLVTTFTPDALNGLEEKLEILRFSGSYLKYISWIAKLKKLEILLMSNNTINQIPDEALPQLKSLSVLDLSSNHLSHWYTRLLTDLKLKVLDLRDNNINVISKEMIADFRHVEYIAIGRNNYLCNCLLRDFLAVAVRNTEDMGCEEKSTDTKITLHPVLPIVHSEYDAYYRVMQMYMHEMKNSKEVILNFPNGFPKVPYELSDGVEASNYDKRINAGSMIQRMRSRLKPGTNEILCKNTRQERDVQEMDKDEREETPLVIKVQLLDYSDEDYKCINSNSTVAYYIAELEECAETRTVPIPDLNGDSMPFGYIIFLPILTFFTIILIIFVYYFRGYDIRYFCITFRNITILSLMDKDKRKLLRRKSTILNEEFNYDVFVSYSDQNRDWVLENLLPNIERPEEINVCLHERDFKVGLTILENIISCMDQSKCILLVISKSFVSSNWCQFELHLAQHRLLETRREQLIIVLLENIPKLSRPRTLQYLMRTKTYLEWPQSRPAKYKNGKLYFQDEALLQEERKMFWKRLQEAIREKQ